MHFTISVRAPRSSPANWYSDSVVGNRRHRAEHRRRIGAQRDRDRKRRRPGCASAWSRKSSAPPRCASQRMISLVAADHLLAVDAEVLPRLVRAARDGQAPGDQRRDIARPAGLHRQPREIDVLAFPDDFLAGRRRSLLRRHVHHLHEHRPRVLPRVACSPLGGSGSLRKASSLPTSRSAVDGLLRPCPAPPAAACRTDCRAPASSGPSASRTAAPGRRRAARGRRSRSSRAADRPPRAMRFSRPRRSSCATKSRRSAYFMRGHRPEGGERAS